jgi:hypothetical protein
MYLTRLMSEEHRPCLVQTHQPSTLLSLSWESANALLSLSLFTAESLEAPES